MRDSYYSYNKCASLIVQKNTHHLHLFYDRLSRWECARDMEYLLSLFIYIFIIPTSLFSIIYVVIYRETYIISGISQACSTLFNLFPFLNDLLSLACNTCTGMARLHGFAGLKFSLICHFNRNNVNAIIKYFINFVLDIDHI